MTERNEFQVPPLDEDTGVFYMERLSTLVEYAQKKGFSLHEAVITYSGNPYDPVTIVTI